MTATPQQVEAAQRELDCFHLHRDVPKKGMLSHLPADVCGHKGHVGEWTDRGCPFAVAVADAVAAMAEPTGVRVDEHGRLHNQPVRGFRTLPNPGQPDRCPSIDPDDTLQCGRRIHDDDQCQFGGIAWKKGTPRHVSDRERADVLQSELDLAHRTIDRMLIGQVALARVLDLPLPDDESLWPDYLADGLVETASARMRTLADERAKVARVKALPDQWEAMADAHDGVYPAAARVVRADARDLRAALAGPEPEATEGDVVAEYLDRLRSMDPSVRLSKHIDEVEAERRPVCPECAQGKHGNCDGTAWDDTADGPTSCTCWHVAEEQEGGA